MGGAINLVTRKPSEKLEGDVRLGVTSGDERKLAVNRLQPRSMVCTNRRVLPGGRQLPIG